MPKHSFAKTSLIIQDFDPILESTCETVMLRSARDGPEQIQYTGQANVPSQNSSGDPAGLQRGRLGVMHANSYCD
jgi:hypothetical protein